MNSLADKILARNNHTSVLRHFSRLIILALYLILLTVIGGFQSSKAQDQWRVFTTANSPLPSNAIGRIVIDTNNIKWIGTNNGLVKIEGNNWTIYDTTNTPLQSNIIDPKTIDAFNNLWVGVAYKGMAKFDGVNWTIYDTTNSGLPSNAITYIKKDAWNVKWIGTFGKGLVRFDDTSWIVYNSTNSGIPGNGVCALELRNNEKWVGSCSFGVGKYNDTVWTIYNTTNSGLPSNYITSIANDNLGNIWICTQGFGLAKFNTVLNQWVIFNSINSGIPSDLLVSIFIYNNIKYIGTVNAGFAIYNDSVWINYNDTNSPLPGNSVDNFNYDKYGNLWIAVFGGVVIYNTSGIIGLNNKQQILPNNYFLYQNKPNPFNPVTRIRYDIPANVKGQVNVRLTVYDVVGREIETLVKQTQKPGNYEITWDGSKYASGVYFYSLYVLDSSSPLSITKKMVLLK